MMNKRLAVIGAGPGGLFAAKEAAAQGLSVTVFESGTVGESIFCAEGFIDVLKLLDPPVAGICFSVNEIIITLIDTFHVDCSNLNIWMIDRQKWQKALAGEAVASGCEIIEQSKITSSELKEITREFDWVIDASGINSVAAEAYNLPDTRKAATAQYTLQGDFSDLVGKLKITLDSRYCGYTWIFPKSPDTANVGIGWFGKREKGLNIKEELDHYLHKEGFNNYRILKITGGPIPISMRKNLVIKNTLLIGDAAGLGSPLHGGGIDTACISGILAARAIAKENPGQYINAVEKIISSRLNLEQQILDLWKDTDLQTLNDYAASAFADDSNKARRTGWRKVIAPEAIVLRAVLSGRLYADWEKGIMLNNLPFVAKLIIQKIMDGE